MPYAPQHKIRIVTAASLFDGHDAAINIMRRLLQAGGAEIIHLGHNRTALDVVTAAVHEDAQAIAISSYQGGHMEYLRYMRRLLDERGASHVKIVGGGGGVIVPDEIRMLAAEGVATIYSPEDGRRLGLTGIIDDVLAIADYDTATVASNRPPGDASLALQITRAEQGVHAPAPTGKAPVIGITGTGGAGKSSLTDELLRRFLLDNDTVRVAVLSVDPTRKRTGGALLGDRIRMNAIDPKRVFMRSLATRGQKGELSGATGDAIALCKDAGFDVIFVETSGIGQGDSGVHDIADVSVYVMTPEFGAASQLEKIDMLDFADLVVVNKLEKRGGLDAVRDVRKQVRRNRNRFTEPDESLPVYGTQAARFMDPGVTALYHGVQDAIAAKLGTARPASRLPVPASKVTPAQRALVTADRERYLGDIARTVRTWHGFVDTQAGLAKQRQALEVAADALAGTPAEAAIKARGAQVELDPLARAAVDGFADKRARYSGRDFVFQVRGKDLKQPLVSESLAHTEIPRVSLPDTDDAATIVRYSLRENVPGEFPYTAGVFALKRLDEEPKRMFAGEGGPARTNERFKLLCAGEAAHRLSTAFDSVTLYGEDPHERPDIYGKVGESGVSVPHLDDMKILYGGFDLCSPTTSVSMTINGPAPMLLAMFMNTAIDQQVDRFTSANGRAPTSDEYTALRKRTLSTVRGTVQADILKEDQAQNTCIFGTEFALRMMGDIQQYFIENDVRNFYSVSVSGYHIAEAGANPVSQLAFTLANGFTFVEYYLARGMKIDDFGPNLSFFFSNGMDPEYAVIGRVARRIWALAMRQRYGASSRAQQLKYHIQTSGRSLHAREIQFNDIRTTLQALLAIGDHCNSLHTNAYDEAITTPTNESVRRAMAIQLILNREFGLMKSENPLQGSFFIEWLTDKVEEAVLQEFERIDERGGVLGAMELQYQRGKIQEESMYYEHKKHDGTLPIVGINTFVDPNTAGADWEPPSIELRRASPTEKDAQIASVRAFQARHADAAPAALRRLQEVAMSGGNVFAELMDTVRVASLGQISLALYAVGGEYRRNL